MTMEYMDRDLLDGLGIKWTHGHKETIFWRDVGDKTYVVRRSDYDERRTWPTFYQDVAVEFDVLEQRGECEPEAIARLRIDSDWQHIMSEYAEGFAADDIAEVLRIEDGDNDGPAWAMVCRLKDGRFAFVECVVRLHGLGVTRGRNVRGRGYVERAGEPAHEQRRQRQAWSDARG